MPHVAYLVIRPKLSYTFAAIVLEIHLSIHCPLKRLFSPVSIDIIHLLLLFVKVVISKHFLALTMLFLAFASCHNSGEHKSKSLLQIDELTEMRKANPDSALALSQNLLDQNPKWHDTLKAKVVVQQAIAHSMRRDFNNSDSLAQILLSNPNNYTSEQVGYCQYLVGLNAYYKGNFDGSLKDYDKALAMEISPRLKLLVTTAIANTQYFTGHYTTALQTLGDARLTALETHDTVKLRNIVFTSALCYQNLSLFALATEELHYYIDLASKTGFSTKDSFRVFAALGSQYSKQSEYVKSNQALFTAYLAAKNLGRSDFIVTAFSNLTNNYILLKQYDSAKYCLDSAYKIVAAGSQPWHQIPLDIFSSRLYRKKGDFTAAKKVITEALEYAERIKYTPKISDLKLSLAEMLEFELDHKGIVRILAPEVKKAERWTQSHKYVAALKLLKKAYRNLGEFHIYDSLNEQHLATISQNSLRAEQAKTNALDYKLKLVEQKQKLASLQQEKSHLTRTSTMKTWLIALATFLLLLSLIVARLLWRNQQYKREKLSCELQQSNNALHETKNELSQQEQVLLDEQKTRIEAERRLKLATQKLRVLKEENSQNPATIDVPAFSSKKTDFDTQWKNFEALLNQTYTGFTDKLKRFCPDLTTQDIRILSLVRTGLDSKEIARIIGIGHQSVNKSRYRIRKKMDLNADDDLLSVLVEME